METECDYIKCIYNFGNLKGSEIILNKLGICYQTCMLKCPRRYEITGLNIRGYWYCSDEFEIQNILPKGYY